MRWTLTTVPKLAERGDVWEVKGAAEVKVVEALLFAKPFVQVLSSTLNIV
jgi:hypothetical protein